MSDNDDFVIALSGQLDQYKMQEKALREFLQRLGQQIAVICHDLQTTYSGRNFRIACLSPDDDIYGHLYCAAHGIGIAYRSTEDDYHQTEEPGVYKTEVMEACPTGWLREIARAENILGLLRGFMTHIKELTEETKTQADFARNLADTPSLAISDDFERVVAAIGYERATADWREAQGAVYTKPERALTLACTLLETICKHILTDLGRELPADQSVSPLFRTTAKALQLDPSGQADPELKGVCGGLSSVVQNLGALRTKFGEAHGKHPNYASLFVRHARLAVNAAGGCATFLVEQHLAMKEGRK